MTTKIVTIIEIDDIIFVEKEEIMIYEQPCPPNTPLKPRTYSFLQPTTVRIRNKENVERLVSFGIGDKIQVLEPEVVYAVVCTKKLKEIPLVDGNVITAFSEDMQYMAETQ